MSREKIDVSVINMDKWCESSDNNRTTTEENERSAVSNEKLARAGVNDCGVTSRKKDAFIFQESSRKGEFQYSELIRNDCIIIADIRTYVR